MEVALRMRAVITAKSWQLCRLLLLLSFGLSWRPEALAAINDEVLVERARGAQAMVLQLMAADLLDELVYQWTQKPPFGESQARVVLLRISAPLGTNSVLATFLENHFFNLLTKNPATGLVPVYCGPCLSLTSYSNSQRTVIARGADLPELGAELKEKADYALAIDLEAEGSQLVLRSYFSSLGDNHLVQAKALSTDTARPPALRQSMRLISVESARREYLDILADRKRLSLHLGVRIDMIEGSSDSVISAPFIWAVLGAETYVNHRKEWLADLTLGIASLDGQYSAYQLGSRVYRHLAMDTVDLSSPDLYALAGLSYWDISGPGSLLFKNQEKLTPGDIVAATEGEDASKIRSHNTTLTLGVEARIGGFIRMGAFIQRFLNQGENANFSNWYHAYGFEFGAVL